MSTATRLLPTALGGVGLLLAFVAFAIVRDRMRERLPVGAPDADGRGLDAPSGWSP